MYITRNTLHFKMIGSSLQRLKILVRKERIEVEDINSSPVVPSPQEGTPDLNLLR